MSLPKSIIIGCDHAAIDLKDNIVAFLKEKNIQVEDIGAYDKKISVDYPDFAIRVSTSVANNHHEYGILICGTGLGMSMAANRFSGIRAALCNDLFSAKMSRQHNNANVLVMGGRIIGDVLAKAIVQTFLDTPFEDGRHADRLAKFDCLGESLNL
ncbi:MAG: ribose 5-phosphate isomerase B [Candidatus Magnetomorum sp.]|nr:ribose 5-phosphate isomerase B [Candidatus Magnetomorum sp.]